MSRPAIAGLAGSTFEMPRAEAERWALVAVALAAFALYAAFQAYTSMTLEDALITFRYAENLASGAGFVYNSGERVLGTTTPLLTLILAALGLVFGADRIPMLANFLLFPATIGAGLFTYFGLRNLGWSAPLSGLVLGTFLVHPTTLWVSAGGMETPLVLLFMAAGFYGLTSKRYLLGAAASSLLVLTRIDGLLWAACVFAIILLRDRRAFVRSVALGALIVGPWLLFTLFYFGTPIPHSLIAKRAVAAVHHSYELEEIVREGHWYAGSLGAVFPAMPLVGLPLFLVGGLDLLRRKSRLPLYGVALFPLALFAAFYFGRAPHFEWYVVPGAWCALIVGWSGLAALAAWLQSALDRLPQGRRLGRAALLAGLLLYVAFLAGEGWKTMRYNYEFQVNENGLRRTAGEWLHRNTPPDARVAMEAIGYQGYFSQRPVIDLAGLASPEVVAIMKRSETNAAAFETICSELRPDYIVLRSYEYDENRHFHGGRLFDTPDQRERFDKAFAEQVRFSAPLPELWGQRAYLTIFARKHEVAPPAS